MSVSFVSILSWLALAIWASEDKIRGRYGAQGVSGYLVDRHYKFVDCVSEPGAIFLLFAAPRREDAPIKRRVSSPISPGCVS